MKADDSQHDRLGNGGQRDETGVDANSWRPRHCAVAQPIQASRARAQRRPRRRRTQGQPERKLPPTEKIVLGFIGVGGMGTGLVNIFKSFPEVSIAAVCDVYEPHLSRAARQRAVRPRSSRTFGVCSTARISTRS